MGIASSGISAPLGQLTPVTPAGVAALSPEELAFLQALSPAFQAILFEVDGMKTAWGGSTAASGRQALSQENAALGYSRSVEVPGVLGSVARALAVNWNALSEEFSALKIKMVSTPLSLKQGGTGADGTTFTPLELLQLDPFGVFIESAGILSTDLSPLIRFFDGMIEETTDIAVFVDTGVITLSLQKSGGGDLNPYFAGTRVAYDTSPADTVPLTAGTDTVPQINYVFLTESGGTVTLVANTTGFPAGTPHVHVATVFCQSVTSLDTDGAFKVHAWIDHLNDSTADGHSSHINEKLRNLPATWVSGVAPADLAANLHLATTAGVVFQLHEHAMPARTMPTDPVWVVNDPTTLYNRITALSGITQDADGTSITNRYFNIVLWGVVSEDATDCKLFINLPSGVYTVESRAQLDDERTSNFAIPSQFRGTAFLIARYTLKDTAGLLTQSQRVDLRGLLPSGSPGGGPGITDHDDLGGLPGGDVHTQYILVNGTRAFSGNQSFGGNAITSVGNVDGRDVSVDGTKLDTVETNADVTLVAGSQIAEIVRWMPPATEAAHMRMYSGGSTQNERYPVWSFDDGQDEYIDVMLRFFGGYDGSSAITVRASLSAENDTSGTASIAIAFRRLAFLSEDTDASHTYVYQTASATCPGTQTQIVQHTDGFTNAQADGVQGGELAILRFFRDVSGDFGWANDVYLHDIQVVLS